MKHATGFTLLELIIVLVIMAMMTAVLLPRFQGAFTSLTFQQAQASLSTTLRYAQALAITQRQLVQLALIAEAPPAYQLLVWSGGTEATSTWQPLQGRFGRRHVLSQGTTLDILLPDGRQRTPATVTFYPNGRADPAQLVLTTAGASATITVDEATGQMHVSTNR